MRPSLILLLGTCFLLLTGPAGAAPDPKETEALEAVGFDLLPDGTITRGFRWKNDKREDVKVTVAYRLNEEESVFKDDKGKWHRARDGQDATILVSRAELDSFTAVLEAVGFAPFPKLPEGWSLRQVAHFKSMPTRMVPDGLGNLIVLSRNGQVWKIDPVQATKTLWYKPEDYLQADDVSALGITFDREGRLYVVCL